MLKTRLNSKTTFVTVNLGDTEINLLIMNYIQKQLLLLLILTLRPSILAFFSNSKTTFVTVNLKCKKGEIKLPCNSKTTFVTVNLITMMISSHLI